MFVCYSVCIYIDVCVCYILFSELTFVVAVADVVCVCMYVCMYVCG